MCGFVGFFSKDHYKCLSQGLIEANSTLSHRGPDATGQYFDKDRGVGFGHCRLSIIDLSSAGHQPMESLNGDAVIAHNGEVYNFKKLRKQLIDKGYHFSSQTDTEVILYAYLEWGPQCLEKLIGMFAIAIWDRRNKTLFLARDRMGIKPLYYFYRDKTLIFGSELKALMAFKAFPREINEQAIPLFLHYQYIPAPRTIFRDTFKLLPGSYLLFDGTTPSVKSYWSLPSSHDDFSQSQINEDDSLVQLDQLLSQSVKDRLISDVPLGALLSGGIDSSLVAALMQKVSSDPVRTFSIGFGEDKYNEAPWAKQVADHLGTNHTELYVDPQLALKVICDLPSIYDEPFADSSAIPTILVSRLTRENVTVALSGDGGDEQFAGYVRYWMTSAMARWQKGVPTSILKIVAGILSQISLNWVERCYLPMRDYLPQRFRVANFQEKFQKLIGQIQHDQLSELYRMAICLWSKADIESMMGVALPVSRFDTVFKSISNWTTLSQLMHIDQQTYLPDCMLTKVDRASMAIGLEVRVPLLDHRVVEFAAGLPEQLKFRNGNGKYLLKKLLSRYVPEKLFERPKMGFGVPIDDWLKGPLKELLRDFLSPERLQKEGRFDTHLINQKIDEHLNGDKNHHHRLWALLMWEMWREQWID